MKASDITQVILVILVFVGLLFANVASAGIENIKKNWPEYRCNPTVMPFAATFGHDPVTNFTDCVAQMQSASMSVLTAPFKFNMGLLGGSKGGLGANLSGSLQANRGMFSGMRGNLGTVIQSVFGVFLNLVIQIQRLFLDLKDLFSKIVGVMATLFFFVRTAFNSLWSVWKGPPGQLLRGLCFDPETRVALEDGSVRAMHALSPGLTLKTGAQITAVLDINNVDSAGHQVEAMYTVPGGEAGEKVRVSGCHLVYSEDKDDFVQVRELEASTGTLLDHRPCPRLTCLVTTDHTIPIGDWVFHDWEDNDVSGRVAAPRIFSC